MHIIVNRKATDIHPYFIGIYGLEFLDLASSRVV